METALLLLALFATALLFGGMAFFAALVAPLTFRLLPAEAGGRFIRGLFPLYYVWVVGSAGAAAMALYPLSGPDAGIMLAIALMALWLRQVLMPRINALSDRVKAGDAAARRGFDLSHRLSVAANLLQMLAAGAVLARFLV